jgi:hypothetical protein
VYPASFEYLAPLSLDEALAELREHGDGAKAMAGGQSLIPLMKLRFAAPEVVVDLNRIPGLDGLSDNGRSPRRAVRSPSRPSSRYAAPPRRGAKTARSARATAG